MAFSFSQCRSVILEGMREGFRLSAEEIGCIERAANMGCPVTGISLDLAPWHGAIGLSLREYTEHMPEVRYCSVEWAYFDLVSNQSCPALQLAADFIQQVYTSENSNSIAREMAHLIFLAGAEALLDAQVAMLLSELGIDAPVCGDCFMPRPFEYMVFDYDGTVPGNYCDLVLANRVTARWWAKIT